MCPAAADLASMELSEVVSNTILSAYDGGLLNVSLSSPPAGDGPAAGAAATSPVLTSNDALLFHEKCGTLIKLSNNNKTAERRRPLDEFNNGVVMTNRPLRDNEMFEVCACMMPSFLGTADRGAGMPGRGPSCVYVPWSPFYPSHHGPRSASTSLSTSGQDPSRSG